jgi:hypothetical protein
MFLAFVGAMAAQLLLSRVQDRQLDGLRASGAAAVRRPAFES